MVIVPFTVGATTVSASDTTPTTIHTFPNDNYIRVPRLLKLHKEANPAFTISNYGSMERHTDLKVRNMDNYAALVSGGPFMVIESADDDGNSRPFFYIPIIGLLDSALEQRIIAYPMLEGAVFNSRGRDTKFRLRFTCNVASGECDLLGELHYEEIPLGGW